MNRKSDLSTVLRILTISFITLLEGAASTSYFSQGNIQLSMPLYYIKPGNIIFKAIPLTSEDKSQDDVIVEVDESPNSKYIDVKRDGTVLWITSFPTEYDTSVPLHLALTTTITSSEGRSDKMVSSYSNRLFVNIIVVKEELPNCQMMLRDRCFWLNDSYYVFKILENRKLKTIISDLQPPMAHKYCPKLTPKYVILNNGPFRIFENKLIVLPGLDREKISSYNISVSCTLDNGTENAHHQMMIYVTVMDEDDNPPLNQQRDQASYINITLYRDNIKQGLETTKEHQLTFTDEDLASTNHYTIEVIEDEMKIIQPVLTSFNLHKTTFLYIKAILTSNALQLLHFSNYTVILKLTDGTLLLGYGNPQIYVTLTFLIEDKMLTDQVTDLSVHAPEIQPSLITKMNTIHYNLHANAANLTRIGFPFPKSAALGTFKLISENNNDIIPFSITKIEGILYLTNPMILKDREQWVAEIRYMYPKSKFGAISDEILSRLTVHVLTSNTTTKCSLSFSQFACSESRMQTDCENECGIAAYMGTCEWRPFNYSNHFSDQYGTCSPNMDHCPDGRCDELESNFPDICRQDCAEEVIGTVKLAPSTLNRRGIYEAVGICTCLLNHKCSCDPVISDSLSSQKHNKEEYDIHSTSIAVSTDIHHYAGDIAPNNTTMGIFISYSIFGISTIMSLVIGSAIIITIPSVIIFWTHRRNIKRGRHFIKPSNNRLPVSSNTVDDSVGHLDYISQSSTSLTELATASLTEDNIFKCGLSSLLSLDDANWEIPRNNLIIESVLGEGEFGRVMKGRAQDLDGGSGGVTVAVKALKGNVSAEECQDFLAEFHLLKKVNHLHVIRLLGVCTLGGSPLLLIMEYAEFGSLRNFLRCCRNLDENPSSSSYQKNTWNIQNHVPSISAKDILSFAWQISKGMAYLSDMKLVHRDLAARNILLNSERTCKISDFGLTRDIYEDDAYFKRSKGKVPVKWLAPESLGDQIYTVQSDVWSFGIVLWELATLGTSPYPGVPVEQLYGLLCGGYRLGKPEGCSQEMYNIMAHCWADLPLFRPSFHHLTSTLEALLEADADYLDLGLLTAHNPCYQLQEDVHNEIRIEDPNEDTHCIRRADWKAVPLKSLDISKSTCNIFTHDPQLREFVALIDNEDNVCTRTDLME